MLPAIHRIKSSAVAATLALSLALPAPAFALNEKEQGILAGALGVLFFQELIAASKHNDRRPVHPAPPVYDHNPYPMPVVGSAHRTPAAYAFASYSPAERRAIQRSLARAGYYYGAVDGAFGPGTYSAVLRYAQASGTSAALRSQAGAYGVFDRLLYGA